MLNPVEATPLPEEIVNEHEPAEDPSEVVTVELVLLLSRPAGAPWAQQHRSPLLKAKVRIVSAAKRTRRVYTDEEKQLALRIMQKCGGSSSKHNTPQHYELFPGASFKQMEKNLRTWKSAADAKQHSTDQEAKKAGPGRKSVLSPPTLEELYQIILTQVCPGQKEVLHTYSAAPVVRQLHTA